MRVVLGIFAASVTKARAPFEQLFLQGTAFGHLYVIFRPKNTILDQLGVQLPSSAVNVQAWIDRIRERPSTQGLET
jgi:hypothetical protein